MFLRIKIIKFLKKIQSPLYPFLFTFSSIISLDRGF